MRRSVLILKLSFSHLLCSFIASTPTSSLPTPVARCATEFMENRVKGWQQFTLQRLLNWLVLNLSGVAKSGDFLLI